MKILPPGRPPAPLALNWAAFGLAFAWTSAVQQDVVWWLRLDWTSGLTRLSAMTSLRPIPAGSMWILWILASAAWTIAWLARSVRQRSPGANDGTDDNTHGVTSDEAIERNSVNAEPANWHVTQDDPIVTAHMGLGEKIRRLQRSLDQI